LIKKAIITVVVIIAIVAGYVIYEEFFMYEPVHEYSEEEIARARSKDEIKDFKPRWKEGNRYVFRFESESTGISEISDKDKDLKNTEKTIQDMEITVLKKRPTGGFEIEVRFFNTKSEYTSNERELKSNKELGIEMALETILGVDADQRVPTMWEILEGITLKYLVDAKGKVEKIEGMESVKEAYISKTKSVPVIQSANMFKELMDKELLKEWVEPPKDFPEKPVKQGDKWSTEQEVLIPGFLKVKHKFKYRFCGWEEKENKKLAVLELKGKLSGKKDQSSNLPHAQISFKGGNSKGRILFDPELGMEVESQIDQEMEMNMKMVMPTSLLTSTSRTIKTHITNITSIKLVEFHGAAELR